MQWVMGFGAQVEVIAPARLRRMVENEAWKMAGKYQKGKTKIRGNRAQGSHAAKSPVTRKKQ